MGTYFSQNFQHFIKNLSERVSLIASDRLWLEDAAVQQLKTTAQLPGMQRVVGLPDLHPGRGYPVGTAFFSIDRFYPALVGNDIGCGMSLWQTNLLAGKVKLDKLDQQIGNLDKGIDDDEWALLENIEPNLSTYLQQLRARMNTAGLDYTPLRSLGTIGGGNHFIELQVTDRIDDKALFTQANMQAKQVQILVHTGSRGDYSYLLLPNTSADNLATGAKLALHSLAHGAGRKWQRTDCKAKLFKLASPTQLSRTALGSRVICDDRALIYEEAPQAYKTVDSVVDCLTGAGLAHVVARNKPILTYKTRGECCE